MMTRKELRQIALGAVRSELRRQGIDPRTVSAESAYAVLDNIYRIDPDVLASFWYGNASQAERSKFVEEWGGDGEHRQGNQAVRLG